MEEKIREAVERIIKNFDSGVAPRGADMRLILSLAQDYLSVKGMPKELEPILVDIGVGTMESEFEKGFNQALHLCKLGRVGR